jgi:uncharacterized protein YciI
MGLIFPYSLYTKLNMLLFIVSLKYKVPLAKIEEFFPAHIAYAERFHAEGKYIISGRREPRVGGILVAANCTLDEIKEIVANDPYNINGIADFEIIDFIPTRIWDKLMVDFPVKK